MQLKKEMPLMAFLLLMFISSTVLYRYVPEKIPTHWNAKGEIDGYSGKFLGLFLLPIIASILYILFLVLPAIMPYRNNIEKIEVIYWPSFMTGKIPAYGSRVDITLDQQMKSI